MPQIHEYAGAIDEYVGSMLGEYDELNRLYENSREEIAVLVRQRDEQDSRETENILESDSTETLSVQQLEKKIQQLETLVIELTFKLEEETNVDSD